MKSILRNAAEPRTLWTPRGLVLAGFTAGLLAGALPFLTGQLPIPPGKARDPEFRLA